MDSAVFLGESSAASLAPLWVVDDHGRLCPRFASIPPHGPVHLVVARAALREPGELSPVCRRACLLSKLRTTQIAWPLIANFSCSPNAPAGSCTRSENMGWRYLLFTLGGCTLLLWAFRFFVFKLEESPRFLAGRGLDAEAAAVVQRIAAFNGRSCSLTAEELTKAGEMARETYGLESKTHHKRHLLSSSSSYTIGHIKALFKTRKLAWSTSLLIALWGTSKCFRADFASSLVFDRHHWSRVDFVQQLPSVPSGQSRSEVRKHRVLHCLQKRTYASRCL